MIVLLVRGGVNAIRKWQIFVVAYALSAAIVNTHKDINFNIRRCTVCDNFLTICVEIRDCYYPAKVYV